MKEDISPPPLKRRRLSRSDSRQGVAASDIGRIVMYSWNINGIAPFLQPTISSFFGGKQPSSPASLRHVLRKYGWPTMLFLQEVKISPDDHSSQKAVQKAVLPEPDEVAGAVSYKAYFSLPSDKHNARGFGRKVYGVCTLVKEDFVEQYVDKIREVDWDAEGRFLVLETKSVGDMPKLAVLNCYMVNGTDAPLKDSETGGIVGTRHSRKLKVHELLRNEVRSYENAGFKVVLAGDMNIARTELDGHPSLRTFPIQHCTNRADFEEKFLRRAETGRDPASATDSTTSLQMIDTFRELHPTKAGYTYYPRNKDFGSSADRVDMILLSRSLEPNLTLAGICETPADRGTSDHVPLYAELSFEDRFVSSKQSSGR